MGKEFVWGVTAIVHTADEWRIVRAVLLAFSLSPLNLCKKIFGHSWEPRAANHIKWPTGESRSGFKGPHGVLMVCEAWTQQLRCAACNSALTPETIAAYTLRVKTSKWIHHFCSEICLSQCRDTLESGTRKAYPKSVQAYFFTQFFVPGFVAGIKCTNVLTKGDSIQFVEDLSPSASAHPRSEVSAHVTGPQEAAIAEEGREEPVVVTPPRPILSEVAVKRLTPTVEEYLRRLQRANGETTQGGLPSETWFGAIEVISRELDIDDKALLTPALETYKQKVRIEPTKNFAIRTLLASLKALLEVASIYRAR